MQTGTANEVYPVSLVVEWLRGVRGAGGNPGDRNPHARVKLIPELGGYLDKPYEAGSFLLRIHQRPVNGPAFSPPFYVKQAVGKKTIVALEPTDFQESGIRHYAKEIPVVKSGFGRKAFYYTHKSSNNVYIAVIRGNKMALLLVGIASQNCEFFLHKEKKYEVSLYREKGSLVIPQLQGWKELPNFIAPLVDTANLPDVSTRAVPTVGAPIRLGPNEAEVLWCNPFGNQIALRTNKGNALLPFKFIKNLNEKDFLVNPQPGTIVMYEDLVEPEEKSQTTFPYIAKGATV